MWNAATVSEHAVTKVIVYKSCNELQSVGGTENSAIYLNYPTFEEKNKQKFLFVHCSAVYIALQCPYLKVN